MQDSIFLTDFLQLSSLYTFLFLAVLVGAFVGIRKMEKKKIKFSTRMIVGTVLGLILGLNGPIRSTFSGRAREDWLDEGGNELVWISWKWLYGFT